MSFDPVILAVVFAAAAALFAFLSYIRLGRKQPQQVLASEELTRLLRTESDRTRPWEDERARAVREELNISMRGFEAMTLKAFRELSDGIGKEVTEFGNRLDRGVAAIDVRTEAIGRKLDQDIGRMGQEAAQNRDALRQAVEAKLDDSSSNQAIAAKSLREEVTGSFRILGEGIRLELNTFGDRLDKGVAAIDNRTESIGRKLDDDIERMGQEATQNRDSLRQVVESKLEEASTKQVFLA
jgi:DNA recombination protein RmuC